MTIEKGKGKEKSQGVQTSRWGFVLPETTMIKSHKASWRSALEGVTVHDASYFTFFRISAQMLVEEDTGLDGDEEARAFERLTDRLSASLQKVGLLGGWQNEKHKSGAYQSATLLLGPAPAISQVGKQATIETSTDDMDVDEPHQADAPQPGPSTSNNKAIAPVRIMWLPELLRFLRPKNEAAGLASETYLLCREVLIMVHPAAEGDLLDAFARGGVAINSGLPKIPTPGSSEQDTLVTAERLNNAPDPWIAAGGKDLSLSRLSKQKRRSELSQHIPTGKQAKIGPSTKNVAWKELNEQLCRQRSAGLNVFELVGPAAGEHLANILKPVDANETFSRTSPKLAPHELLHALLKKKDNSGPSPFEDDAIVAFEVHDPRLSFPPKASTNRKSPLKEASDLPNHPTLANSRLLSYGSTSPRFSKGEIDSRRAKQAIPGSRLIPDTRDDVVPVVVIKQRMADTIDKFTLIVPRGWGLAFFLSLVHTNQSGGSSGARVLGQKQMRHQALEIACLNTGKTPRGGLGDLFFPDVWIGSSSYAALEAEASQLRREEWQRRPKGKRVEFEFASSKHSLSDYTKEGVKISFRDDRVGSRRPHPFGGPEMWQWIAYNADERFGLSQTTVQGTTSGVWLCSLSKHEAVDAKALEQRIKDLGPLLAGSALVPVKLTAVRKGTVEPLASILLPASYDDHQEWIQHLDATRNPLYKLTHKSSTEAPLDRESVKIEIERRLELIQLGDVAPGSKRSFIPFEDHSDQLKQLHNRSGDWSRSVGIVQSGDYSLGKGRGFGIGAIALPAWLELLQREERRVSSESAGQAKGGRKKRNPIDVRNMVLVRQVGTDVLRACTAEPFTT